MKGTILFCLRDMLMQEKGVTLEQWKEILEAAGMNRNTIILLSADVDDGDALQIFGEVHKRYYTSHQEMADAFGAYWCINYAPRVYRSVYYGVKSAREFIIRMDQMHLHISRTVEESRPSRPQYEALGVNKLLVHYRSKRELIHIYAGLCRGIGQYFGERVEVKVLDNERLAIEFLAAA